MRGGSKKPIINEFIEAEEVRLVAADGSQAGVVSIADARIAAADAKLDLVLIAPDADPKVCKIMDYGKHVFDLKKQKAANKIVKKMGDKGKYDSQNQLKTLVVMQVLGNSKDFFSTQQNLPDIEGFFTDVTLPDSTLSTNNMAQYFLFGGSNSAHNELVDMQYR